MIVIDIEPAIVERVKRLIEAEMMKNVEARLADVHRLPFEDETFYLIYLIAVIGEIPDPVRAMEEFKRVLAHEGTLVFSELFVDPDYPLARTLTAWARKAGFQLKQKIGHFFYFKLVFEKAPE